MTDTTVVSVPAPRAQESLTERACRAYFTTWSAMTVVCPGGTYAETDGVVRARTQLPVAPFNGVWSTTRDVSVAAVLDAVDDFRGGALPWNLQLRPGYPAELDRELADRGLATTGQIPFMVLSDRAVVDAVVAGAGDRLVRQVTSFVDVDATLSLLEQGFSMPPALTRVLFPMRLLLLPGTATWLVSADGQDVSTALGAVVGDCCGVFNVATPEAHRGRGHGALATAQVVVDGLAAGATSAYLQSSPMGYPVYEKLGFSTAERWQQWMPKEYLEQPVS